MAQKTATVSPQGAGTATVREVSTESGEGWSITYYQVVIEPTEGWVAKRVRYDQVSNEGDVQHYVGSAIVDNKYPKDGPRHDDVFSDMTWGYTTTWTLENIVVEMERISVGPFILRGHEGTILRGAAGIILRGV